MRKGINGFNMTSLTYSNYTIRIRKATLLQFCLLILTVLIHRSTSAPISDPDGFISTTTNELSSKEFIVELPFSFRIFGEGKFNSIYVNPVGGISFSGGISTSKLESIKNKVIVFAPLLLLPEIEANVTVQFKFDDAEKEAVQQKFRDVINEPSPFNLLDAVKITWNEDSAGDGTGNVYELLFANDASDRTFVIYDYIQVDRIEDDHGYSRAGIFALEDGSILCPYELDGSGTENIITVEDFSERVDLPLKCRSFNYSCSTDDPETASVAEKLNAQYQALFFETQTPTDWIFYRLYFCQTLSSKPDGSVSIKETCGYDPDYYDYSWRPTTDADICSARTDIRSLVELDADE